MGLRQPSTLFFLQFTLEAITLTVMGGFLGVAPGAASPRGLVALPARMLVFWTSFGFGSAAAAGLLFGIDPACKIAISIPLGGYVTISKRGCESS